MAIRRSYPPCTRFVSRRMSSLGWRVARGPLSEIDWDAAIWRIPGERMKMKRPHLVPLSQQALAILRDAHALTGEGDLMFPAIGIDRRAISENTLNAAHGTPNAISIQERFEGKTLEFPERCLASISG